MSNALEDAQQVVIEPLAGRLGVDPEALHRLQRGGRRRRRCAKHPLIRCIPRGDFGPYNPSLHVRAVSA